MPGRSYVDAPSGTAVLRLRHACAWTLLAVSAFGGTVAPAVHHAAHGLERAAAIAAHAADGHHGPGGNGGERAAESCSTRLATDLACTLCQGLSAALLLSCAAAGHAARAQDAPAGASDGERSRPVGAPSGRGPPERVA